MASNPLVQVKVTILIRPATNRDISLQTQSNEHENKQVICMKQVIIRGKSVK